MHPIIADQMASQLVDERRRRAAVQRRVLGARPHRPWRARQARRLLALARRLDPAVDPRAATPRAATAR